MTERMKDFNVKLTVRSARIIDAINEKFGSQANMARETGINPNRINGFVTMRSSPTNTTGWTRAAENFAAALSVPPSEIWPEHLRDVRLKQATAELSLDFDDVQAITNGSNIGQRMLIAKATDGILPRQLAAVFMYHEGATLDEVGRELNVTRERARQIILIGERKMRLRMEKIGITKINEALEEYQ